MAATKRELIAPREIVEVVLHAAGPRLVLIGGQALALWMDRYGVRMPETIPYVSRDIDFLAESAAMVEEVHRLARVLGGEASIPDRRAQTILVGQAVRNLSDTE